MAYDEDVGDDRARKARRVLFAFALVFGLLFSSLLVFFIALHKIPPIENVEAFIIFGSIGATLGASVEGV